ncbi:MetQ/NlpA family lipoprotein [Serratia proteamaculans]|uniref:MetQ/NlpA family lipoprotein n=1 Tax=Serratia proteamaculans TaxID=28151 RepID=UPI0039B01B40
MTLTLKKLAATLAVTSTLLLTACGPAAQDNHHIKVGISSGIDQSLWAVVQKVAKQKYDLDVEVVTFNDYVLPNEALNNGDLDINAFQHKPYLEKQIQERGYKLVAVGNTFVYPIAGYSKKISALSQLPDGAQVAVPNDPTNLGRSLLLLQKQGLIGLKDGVGLFVEDKNSPYVNIFASRVDNQNNENVKNLVKAYQTDEVAASAAEIYKGDAVKGW